MSASIAAYLTTVAVLIAAAAAGVASAADYTNHTVGGPAGWFFNSSTNTSAANYSAWAAAPQTFNLGDFLIFNTNTNQTVVQSYNATTYDTCASGDADLIFSSGATAFGEPLTIAVPLTKVGPNYFFSDADDGAQCQRGMRFEVDVDEGSGLPPSLNHPPPPAYTPPPIGQPPPVFQGSGGGQGENIFKGGAAASGGGGVAGAAVIGAALLALVLG